MHVFINYAATCNPKIACHASSEPIYVIKSFNFSYILHSEILMNSTLYIEILYMGCTNLEVLDHWNLLIVQ